MNIRCIALVTVTEKGKITKGIGKRRLVPCGKRMVQIDQYTWECSSGHKRKYPADEWEKVAFKDFYQTETKEAASV